jgi:hypothetical protein
MNKAIVEDVLIDLILDDVMEGSTLFEFNPRRDAAGRFTSKGAGEAYAHGIMAAGRIAGMLAKDKGADRERVRAAIKAGMEKHVQTAQHAKDFLNMVYGKGAGDDVRSVLDVMGPKLSLPMTRQTLKYRKQYRDMVQARSKDTELKLNAKNALNAQRQAMKNAIPS